MKINVQDALGRIVVASSATPAVAGTSARLAGAVVAGVLVQAGLAEGDDAQQIGGLAVGAATAAWGIFSSLRKHKKAKQMADALPDSVAVVK